MQKLLRYFHTLKYLRFEQFYFRLYYLLRGKWRRITGKRVHYLAEAGLRSGGFRMLPETVVKNAPLLQMTDAVPSYVSFYPPKTFRFLNLSHEFGGAIDWRFADFGKLWNYNLNYFEFLLQPGLSKEQGLALINDFIDSTQKDRGCFEPYPVSLRTINWLKFLAKHQVTDERIAAHLREQYRALCDHLEYHILGNHLLENGFSLLFGAVYFTDDELFKHAHKILTRELPEQILPDGAHFELSPMYHQIMLYRVMDCWNILNSNATPWPHAEALGKLLQKSVGDMLGWLQAIVYKNGAIPLVNDATTGIAPVTADLLAYAQRLQLAATAKTLKESGYRKFTGTHYECLVDVGAVGPDYIPGHAHSDTLAFELYVNGQAAIVDVGISTYEKNERRQAERATASHNTVQIAGEEQTDVWGGFRVGRRAKIAYLRETEGQIVAAHTGYQRLGVMHERTFAWQNESLQITDKVSGRITEGKAYFHFSDGCFVEISGKTLLIRQGMHGGSFRMHFGGALKISAEAFNLPQGYNNFVQGTKIIINFDSLLSTTIAF